VSSSTKMGEEVEVGEEGTRGDMANMPTPPSRARASLMWALRSATD
jgi:hypothetical protein